VSALGVREAYRLWASTYSENAVTSLDEELAAAMSPSPRGLRLLDAGCGTGRRVAGSDAALAIGVDVSQEMLNAGVAPCAAAADIVALPFADGEFDLVWCRLVLSYVAQLENAYQEFARVLRPGGQLFVSDFHPDAVAAGHKRTFRDTNGELHEVLHFVHPAERHVGTAARAGLSLVTSRDGKVGESVRSFYDSAGRSDLYERDRGLKVVAAFLFERST
jgi:malonyl-CoA O-methyltransferase